MNKKTDPAIKAGCKCGKTLITDIKAIIQLKVTNLLHFQSEQITAVRKYRLL
jgi:hypothetical protein